MTKKIDYDFVSRDVQNETRFFTVLMEDLEVETTENLTSTYKRGIYSFETAKRRDAFTMLWNSYTDGDPIAFKFTARG
jgi:hypothetical protein